MSLQLDLWKIFNTAKRNSETVIWQNSVIGSNVRPPKPYITIKLLNIRQIGTDQYFSKKLIASGRLRMNQIVHHELVMNCQYLSDTTESLFDAEEIRSYVQSVFMSEYISKLDSDISVMRTENVIDVSALIKDSFESRSSFDVVFSVAITREELVEFIETINVNGKIAITDDDIIVDDIEIDLT